MNLPKPRQRSSITDLTEEASLARELPYWDILDDGVVVLADGSLATAYRLRGVAIETWDESRINQCTLDLRAALNGLPDGTEITLTLEANNHVDCLIDDHKRIGADEGSVASWIADSRVSALAIESSSHQLLKTHLMLTVYQRPMPTKAAIGASLLNDFLKTPGQFSKIRQTDFDRRANELKQTAASIASSFDSMGISATPLDSAEVWDLLFRWLNPSRTGSEAVPKLRNDHRTIEFAPAELSQVPELSLPSPREQLLYSDLVMGSTGFAIDAVHHRIITLKALPEFTHSAMASNLSAMGVPFVWQVHIKVPDQSDELAKLQAKRRMAHSMSLSSTGRASDLESEAKLQSTEELLREIIGSGQKIFYAQTCFLLRSKCVDDLEQKTKVILGKLRELGGAEGLTETVATFRVWKTMLPFGNVALARSRRFKADNLTDLLPVYEPWEGPPKTEPVCLFKSRSRSLVKHDPFDPALPNYNALVTGSSGSGKSFINNLILLQCMTRKPITYIIDVGGSYRKLCEFFDGQYVAIAPAEANGEALSINPFELPVGQTEPSPRKIKFLLTLLEGAFADEGTVRLGKLDRSLLEEAIIRVYESTKKSEDRAPLLSDLAKHLAKSPEPALVNFSKMLFPWTGSRPYGRLLDRPNALNLASDLVVFDLKGLSTYPDLQAAMILIVTDFILGRVESTDPAIASRTKRIIMDEAWELLKNPSSASFMEYCVRTLRKTGSGITFITQGLEEIMQSPIGGAILSNTATKLILKQRGDLDPVKKILRFNDQEMALIASLRQVKGEFSEAFLCYGDDRVVIRACPTPLEYWLATSDSADNAALANYRAGNPAASIKEAISALADLHPYGAAFSK